MIIGGVLRKILVLLIVFTTLGLLWSKNNSGIIKIENGKEFEFTWNLISSLYYCQWALSYEDDSGKTDNFVDSMSALINSNNKYEEAKSYMVKYLKNENEFINTVSKGIITGIDLLIDSNNNLIEMMKKMTNLNTDHSENQDYELAKFKAQTKKGFELITISSGYLLYVIVEPPKIENPKGQIPFKISISERKQLVKELNKLFKEYLGRYYKYKSLQRQGKQGNPKDQTFLIFAVDNIKKLLTTETYEDAKNNE